jgi:hypothetical protein
MSDLMSAPFRVTVPPDGSSIPVSMPTVVDLPDPLGPSRPSTAPARMPKFTSRTPVIAE